MYKYLNSIFHSIFNASPWASYRCDYYYLGNTKGMVVMNSNKLFLPTEDFGVTPHVINECEWEKHETLLVQKLLKPGQVWIEIGANIGYYTVNMGSYLKETGKILSFEASPFLYETLKHSISVNGLKDTVLLNNKAVWNTTGKTIEFFDTDKSYIGSSHIDYNGVQAGKTIPVQTITLDDSIEQELLDHSRIDFIKMDIEGAECSALEGASKILDQSKNLSIIMEWNTMYQTESGSIPLDCLKNLQDKGFDKMYTIQLDSFISYEWVQLKEVSIDYLVETPDHLDIFITKSHLVHDL